MSPQELTYKELIKTIQSIAMENQNTPDCSQIEFPKLDNLICLTDQFYLLTLLPAFELRVPSQNIKDILGIDRQQLTLKSFYKLVHPEDIPIVLLATKKMIEAICNHYDDVQPFEAVFTLDFRMKLSTGSYSRFLNQNCVVCKENTSLVFMMLSLYTDITHIKTSNKIEFDYKHNGSGSSIIFPDDELTTLVSCFTQREREILSLLATGKNSRDIGDILHISRNTVDTHRRNMLAKSHLCNTTELVAYAIKNEMI